MTTERLFPDQQQPSPEHLGLHLVRTFLGALSLANSPRALLEAAASVYDARYESGELEAAFGQVSTLQLTDQLPKPNEKTSLLRSFGTALMDPVVAKPLENADNHTVMIEALAEIAKSDVARMTAASKIDSELRKHLLLNHPVQDPVLGLVIDTMKGLLKGVTKPLKAARRELNTFYEDELSEVAYHWEQNRPGEVFAESATYVGNRLLATKWPAVSIPRQSPYPVVE